ncbi:MAG: hypothetical protein LWX54_01670 [Deltaproteobacteria bacterium]|nr:hypothetical protein [Deltaproteobacteria bacterium]
MWSPLFGFGDAYSSDPHYFEIDEDGNLEIHPATWLNGGYWVNHMMMGIDEGPLLLAIENYRSGFVWNLTNNNVNIKAGLDSIYQPPICPADFDSDGDVDGSDLARLAANPSLLDVFSFAAHFGRTGCQLWEGGTNVQK